MKACILFFKTENFVEVFQNDAIFIPPDFKSLNCEILLTNDIVFDYNGIEIARENCNFLL